jgi:hypothetical protein
MDDERAARGRGRGCGLAEGRRDEECGRMPWSVCWLSGARTAEGVSERRQKDSRREVWASVGLVGGEAGESVAEDAA